MNEFFDMPGFAGVYQMNELIEVRRIAFVNKSDGFSRIKVRFDKSKGYMVVDLSKNGISKAYPIHRMLAIIFIPNPDNLPFVRHLNDNRIDNRLINLAWGTRRDNMDDAVKNGRMVKAKGNESKCYGKIRPYAKHVRKIFNLKTGETYGGCGEAARSIGINVNTLRCKLNGFSKNNTELIFI